MDSKKELSEGFIVLKPLGDRVIIEVAQEEEKTVGGIVLASSAKEKPQTGTVVAVGEGRLLENGEKVPAAIKVGDQVMFEKYAGTEVKFEGTEYLIVSGKDIMAIVE
ncbi:chaperonin [Enterococcus pernyi]|uniref:Co-chaperonin GroES n=1 Tax=Enterococcus mundtii TaxID=53346 RepID=A0A1I4K1T8_ENTMU|nr:co-chaperone GroES [Enterococcus mundtii]MDA9428305.1 Heat shock protein 60 family co-chaperone GroES [Enterococcus mundtii 1A]MDA9460686.1 Heat shock protein 60 family co-chaperone GroES [Enterococcus mundtii 3F]OTP28398.1 chaperonin [Enterococcus mundtii]SFL72493.1 chaperonin GroES [Enterococcus mundtii]STD26645.1 chaperonin GroS [Enterococcus mundtii]